MREVDGLHHETLLHLLILLPNDQSQPNLCCFLIWIIDFKFSVGRCAHGVVGLPRAPVFPALYRRNTTAPGNEVEVLH